MLWLPVFIIAIAWWLLRRKGREGPELDKLRDLSAAYATTLKAMSAERHRARTLLGEERAAAFDGIEVIDVERRRAEVNINRLRASLARAGFNVSALPALPTIEEAEDAALLEEAERELDREIGGWWRTSRHGQPSASCSAGSSCTAATTTSASAVCSSAAGLRAWL